MKAMGRYQVTSKRPFKGFQPGEQFDADLDPAMETRAINRGSIRLLERLTADLVPGSYRLPDGWPPQAGRKEVS